MVVCYANVLIRLFGVSSLKEKRSIVRSLLSQLKKHFEVSVIEAGRQDSKDYILVGLAFASISEKDCERKIENIESFIDSMLTVEEFIYDYHHF